MPNLLLLGLSALLVFLSAILVAAEYSLVSSRRSRLDTLAKRGNLLAKDLIHDLADVSRLIAACQVGTTMLSIGLGSMTEPFVQSAMSQLTHRYFSDQVSFGLSFLVISYLMVVIGELVPKYITLKNPEAAALILYRPIKFLAMIFYPLVWIAQNSAKLVLKIFGLSPSTHDTYSIPKEELLLLIQAGSILEQKQADVVSRALKLDSLTAKDVMVHRLDLKWLDSRKTKSETLKELGEIPFSRVPVGRGDIDDILGFIYVQDVLKALGNEQFSLETIARPVIAVPETLTLDRVLTQMRNSRSQILLVVDEYGGTSGIITLEDVIEELFGNLEGSFEDAEAPIQSLGTRRLIARADVRMDELANFLGIEMLEENTDNLATVISEGLEAVPKKGDRVDFKFGRLKVEEMQGNRILKVIVILSEVNAKKRQVEGTLNN